MFTAGTKIAIVSSLRIKTTVSHLALINYCVDRLFVLKHNWNERYNNGPFYVLFTHKNSKIMCIAKTLNTFEHFRHTCMKFTLPCLSKMMNDDQVKMNHQSSLYVTILLVKAKFLFWIEPFIRWFCWNILEPFKFRTCSKLIFFTQNNL